MPEPSDRPQPAHAVLVVDNEPAICDILARGLGARGLKVFVARSGGEAVEILRTHRGEIGLALIDGCMPVMGGAATARALRLVRPGLPCCLMSGLPDEDDGSPGLGGWSLFLAKPFDIDGAARALRQLLAERSRPPGRHPRPAPPAVATTEGQHP